MAPAAQVSTTAPVSAAPIASKGVSATSVPSGSSAIAPKAPLKRTGILDALYPYEELTPNIGRVYPTLQLSDVLKHPKADEIIRDIAITISRRGVVFFKNQELTPEEQKYFTDRLGHVTGKPSSSGLHIHPVYNAERTSHESVVDAKGTRNTDNEISVISSVLQNSLNVGPRSGADEWHSDVTFENVPADYTSLKVFKQPPTGGDTLWASGYEVYDLLSEPFKNFFDTLTGHFEQPEFIQSSKDFGYRLHPGPRGAAENVGVHLSAEHPFIRTNPVTGWKSVFGVGQHFSHIRGVTPHESALIKDYIVDLFTRNHITQVRYRWGINDLAVWDNRSTYHAATPDYFALGPRGGVRAVSCGERPYFDPNSRSRRDELGNDKLI